MIAHIEEQVASRARAERAALEHVVERLSRRFANLDADVIRETVRREFEGYSGARVRDFIPILVERAVRDDLTAGTRNIA